MITQALRYFCLIAILCSISPGAYPSLFGDLNPRNWGKELHLNKINWGKVGNKFKSLVDKSHNDNGNNSTKQCEDAYAEEVSSIEKCDPKNAQSCLSVACQALDGADAFSKKYCSTHGGSDAAFAKDIAEPESHVGEMFITALQRKYCS